jgi:hypothetical protein
MFRYLAASLPSILSSGHSLVIKTLLGTLLAVYDGKRTAQCGASGVEFAIVNSGKHVSYGTPDAVNFRILRSSQAQRNTAG